MGCDLVRGEVFEGFEGFDGYCGIRAVVWMVELEYGRKGREEDVKRRLKTFRRWDLGLLLCAISRVWSRVLK